MTGRLNHGMGRQLQATNQCNENGVHGHRKRDKSDCITRRVASIAPVRDQVRRIQEKPQKRKRPPRGSAQHCQEMHVGRATYVQKTIETGSEAQTGNRIGLSRLHIPLRPGSNLRVEISSCTHPSWRCAKEGVTKDTQSSQRNLKRNSPPGNGHLLHGNYSSHSPGQPRAENHEQGDIFAYKEGAVNGDATRYRMVLASQTWNVYGYHPDGLQRTNCHQGHHQGYEIHWPH